MQPPGGDQTFIPADALPDGLHLRFVNRDIPQYAEAWVALYGDPSAEDPLAEDLVHVIYYVGSETGIGWREGTAGERWVVHPTDDDDQEVDDIVVGGRGLGEDDLRGLAERVVLSDPHIGADDGSSELRRAHLAERDLTSKRVLLAEGPLDLSAVWSTSGGVLRGGPALQWVGDEWRSSLRISSVASDPATSLLIRSVIEDPEATRLRGTDVALGSPAAVPRDDWPEVHLAVWEEAGLLTVAQAEGLTRDELAGIVAHLRLSDEADWPRLVDEAEQAPPIVDWGTVIAAGSFDGGRWWVALIPSGGPPQIEQWIEAVDGQSFVQGGAGGCNAGYSVGHAVWETGSLVSGLAPTEATRTVIDRVDGTPIEVTTTPLPDGTASFWNVWVDGPLEITAVTVHDAADQVLQRMEGIQTTGVEGGTAVCRQP